jgi:hypothetical protein
MQQDDMNVISCASGCAPVARLCQGGNELSVL